MYVDREGDRIAGQDIYVISFLLHISTCQQYAMMLINMSLPVNLSLQSTLHMTHENDAKIHVKSTKGVKTFPTNVSSRLNNLI